VLGPAVGCILNSGLRARLLINNPTIREATVDGEPPDRRVAGPLEGSALARRGVQMGSVLRVSMRSGGFAPLDRRPGARRLALLLAVLAMAVAPRTGTAQAQEAPAPAAPAAAAPTETHRHVWLDAEGGPLPFQSDAEILEFLRTARVVGRKRIPVGVNRPEELLLEENGVRAHAAFRVVDVELKQKRVGQRFYFRFVDSYRNECAAYQLSRRLGLDFVPPAVLREIDGKQGSVQIWLENAKDSEGFRPPDVRAWVAQVWDKDLFDNLILNVDRNLGNVLRDDEYRLWLIDHTRAFQPERQLLNPEVLARVKRRVWERLVAMSEDDLKDLVGPYLDGGQVGALVKRRELLIEYIEKLAAERGDTAVFY
jgi:hypothetical protein